MKLIIETDDGEKVTLWEPEGELVVNHTGLPIKTKDGESLTGENNGELFQRMYQIMSDPPEVLEHES